MIELVVNKSRPTPHIDVPEPELRAECQGILVAAAKNQPRRIVVFADLDDGMVAAWSNCKTKKELEAFTDSGLALLFPQPKDAR